MKKFWIIVLITGLCQFAYPQEKMDLTLNQAISLALQNNNNYLISQQGVKQSKYRVMQNMGFLPQVTLGGSKNLDEKLMVLEMPPMVPGGEPQRITLDFTKDYEFTLQIVQPVFTGGKIWHAFRNARLDLKISREKERNTRDEVTLNVKKVFNNILVLEELLKAHQEVLNLAENNYKNVKDRFELGMVSQYDLLRAELTASAIKPNILNARKMLELSLFNLKIMLALPESTELNIQGKLSYDRHDLEVSELIQRALQNRSEIKQMEMEAKKVNNLLKIAYAQFVPDFSIIASYSYRSDLLKLRKDNWEDFYTINLGISFPIFTGLKRSGQVGELRVMKKMMKLRAKELDDATRLQVQNLVLTIGQEYENILTGEKNTETAQEGVRIAELNYQEGMISILELNASYNELTQAKVAYLQAVYNYSIALAELEKISGVQINGGQR
jgi:outer membrane protein